MRIRPYVYAALALVAAMPATALAGTAVTASIPAAQGEVAAGATVQVICWAEGSPSTMGQPTTAVQIDVSVTGGTVTPTTLTGAVSTPCSFDGTKTCSVIQGSASWATPGVPASHAATCAGKFQTTFGGSTTKWASAPLTTIAAPTLPPVVSAVGGPGEVAVGTSAVFDVTASDPNAPSRPLTYAWSATDGTITPDATGASARWTAPQAPGLYDVAVTVSNGEQSSQSTRTVNVVLASFQAGLPVPLSAPRRLAATDSGALVVVDGRQPATGGQLALATARGEVRGFGALPEPALAVASGAGSLWVTTAAGSVYRVDPVSGRTAGKVPLQGAPLRKPLGAAWDAAGGRLWIAETGADRVRVITPDGATVARLTAAGGAPLVGPVDVAIDAAAGRAWVLVGGAESSVPAGAPIAAARYLHAFDLAGQYLGSYLPQGGGAGKLTRGGGVAVGAGGRVYVSDAYQGAVQVLDRDGASLGVIGALGAGTGQLMNPMGLAAMANGDVAIANATQGRIERFGSGADLPVCSGDLDCDGLLDAWETANDLDAYWAGNALVDLDGDGLVNAEEHAALTNPRSVDSDGDGFGDREELVGGFDPNAPNDHAAVVSATGPAEVPPGIVRLSAVAAGPGTCGFRWSQRGGPGATLRDPETATPSFVARAAGAYEFDAVASCGGLSSAPGRVRVVVRNVPPMADLPPVIVATPGSALRLDALASSDANGDALGFAWDQTLGAPVIGAAAGGAVTTRARGQGLYAFRVTVSDPGGESSEAEVPVLVAAGPAPTAIAAADPAEAEPGSTVVLDASGSLAHPGATYAWRQVSGPEDVPLTDADDAVAWFVPQGAGRYVFEVSIQQGALRSPPGRVDVFVAERGRALPTVTATSPSIVAVRSAVPLDAVASGGAGYAWRQVSGPAAGLSDADRATATAVPFVPGFYVFEVSVRDGEAVSRPARVAFEARQGDVAIPKARVAVRAGDAWVGELVFLDGRGSTGAARFRWTQVGGPWVALGAQAAVTSFRPLAAGVYAFELQVDDGAVRSAPARVEVNVVSPEGGR
jgi:hypothetical protein